MQELFLDSIQAFNDYNEMEALHLSAQEVEDSYTMESGIINKNITWRIIFHIFI